MASSQNIQLGVIYGAISAFSTASMRVFVKMSWHDLPISMLIFFRFFISLILLLPWLFNDPPFKFSVDRPLMYLTRSISALLALVCLSYVIKVIFLWLMLSYSIILLLSEPVRGKGEVFGMAHCVRPHRFHSL